MGTKAIKLQEKKERAAGLDAEAAALKPSVDRYYELSRQSGKLHKEITEEEKRNEYWRVTGLYKYEEPVYPCVGSASEPAWATFESKGQADELMKLLNAQSGYGYHFEVKWTKSGRYRGSIDYRYDHDRDICYEVTFQEESINVD